MARIEIPATTEIIDDLTGRTVTDAKSVKLALDGKPYTLDLSAETVAALTAFLAGPTDEHRRAFGALIPRPKVGTTRAASNGSKDTDSPGVSKRDYLRANGHAGLAERGKFTDEMNSQWTAHLAQSVSEPASA